MTEKKFKLQDRYDPKRECALNLDNDRSTCCAAEIYWFEAEFKRTKKGVFEFGGYEGCSECGAMIRLREMPERPELQPYSIDDIYKAMVETYDACAHDVLANNDHWYGSDLFDFVVSTNGHHVYRFTWDKKRYDITDRETIDAAVKKFDDRYNPPWDN